MQWKIKIVPIKNQVGLAPMAGVSNPAYMKICEEMGVGYAVTELISAEAVVRNNSKTFEMLRGIETLKIPVGIQIFGSSAPVMAQAAKILADMYPIQFIDINMGCPVPKVAVRSSAGSALLKNPNKVFEIVSQVVESISIPVTVKIRSGWDQESINACEIAKICEEAGASAIFVHPRTRSQGYSGLSNWQIIKQVKETVHIPVIGNGDITTPFLAQKMLNETGCDAVMIGRGALGNPWLIKDTVLYLDKGILPKKISYQEKIDMCLHHLKYLNQFKSEHYAVLEIRSHIAWYLKGIPSGVNVKNKIFQCKTLCDIMQVLKKFKEDFHE